MPGVTGGPTVLFGRHYVWFLDRGTGRWFLLRDVDADARADRLAGARARILESLERSLASAAARS